MSRLATASKLLYSLPELLSAGQPIPGLTVPDITKTLWYKGTVVPWPLVSGHGVSDQMVVQGSVYFQELETGVYLVRWVPSTEGYWKLVLTTVSGARAVVEVDVQPA